MPFNGLLDLPNLDDYEKAKQPEESLRNSRYEGHGRLKEVEYGVFKKQLCQVAKRTRVGSCRSILISSPPIPWMDLQCWSRLILTVVPELWACMYVLK